MTRFVAIDGEATGGDRDQSYVLLCSSAGGELEHPEGLPTVKILEWLTEQQTPGVELVVFGLNFDVNHWLRDVPGSYLRELWDTGWILWHHWRIEWTPARLFKIKHQQTGAWATVQEVFGFFNCSFLRALDVWGIPRPVEIEHGKAGRATHELGEDMRRYCRLETKLLEALMSALDDAAAAVELTPYPHNWIGAGALASTALRTSIVQEHHEHDDTLATTPMMSEAVMTAYYGARAEVFRQGPSTGVQSFDIRSAYPAAALELPSLRGAKLMPRRSMPDGCRHGIFRATWHALPGDVMPLPVRFGRAYWWAAGGAGWYHAAELQAALAAGFDIQVGAGYELVIKDFTRPFAFVAELYQHRLALERAGDLTGAQVVKLGLNAIYGKLSQGHGRRGLPRWQSFLWAGELTARTRAKLLPVLMSAHRPIMVATDCVFAAAARGVRASSKLGGWRHGRLDYVFAVNAGVYHGTAAGQEVVKSSGFFQHELDYQELVDGWHREGVDYVHHYRSRRFIGLGVAIARRHPDIWREWLAEDRRIIMHPARKDPELVAGAYQLHPVARAPGDSEPYNRGERLIDSRELDNEMGNDQKMREVI